MNIIVLQHIKIEDPGYIKDLMLADGFNLTTVELNEGEKIPSDLSKFDQAAKNNMTDMNKYSKTLYENFKKIII